MIIEIFCHGESFGLKFIPDQSEFFGVIPKFVSRPNRILSSRFGANFQSSVRQPLIPIRMNPGLI